MFSVYSHYKQNTRVTWRRSTWHYTSNSYIHIVLYFKFIHTHCTILQIHTYTLYFTSNSYIHIVLHFKFIHTHCTILQIHTYTLYYTSNSYIDMVLYFKYSIPYLKYSTNISNTVNQTFQIHT